MNTFKIAALKLSSAMTLLTACGSSTTNQLSTTDQTRIENKDPVPEDKNSVTANASTSEKKANSSQLTWKNGADKIFANNCGRCHTDWAINFDQVKAKKSKIIQRINSTSQPMPPTSTPAWTSNKAKALEYLSSPEMNSF